MQTKSTFIIVLSLTFLNVSIAQNLTQTIRGTVTDVDTKEPLIGAEVYIKDSNPLLFTTSDLDGNFVLEEVPVGRTKIECSYLGYNTYLRDNIQVVSAREYILEIELKAGVELTEVVVKAYSNNEAVNESAVASIRRLDPEELQYHAASANDPGRLVMGLPGVQPSRDTRSDIVIRGNSSSGILWRLEGIDIPNPNHFARRGSSGGGITIFSASMLGSSDFSTGAFTSEYGNVFSGAFDMRFRNGDMNQHQHTFRAGILGLDFATEGPIKKGKSSYLANFRYSTLGILNAAGIHLVGPRVDNNFQDFSFKISHKGKKVNLSFWGMGGNSIEIFNPEEMPFTTYSDYTAYNFTTRMGVVGATLNYLIDSKSFFQLNTGIMSQQIHVADDTLNVLNQHFTVNDENYLTSQWTAHAFYKRTFNARWNVKIGNITTASRFNLFHKKWDASTGSFNTYLDTKNNQTPTSQNHGFVQQNYIQFSYRPSNKLVIHAGAHALFSATGSDKYSLEPRLSAKYQLTSNNSLSFSVGRYSRVLPAGTYYVMPDPGTLDTPNKNLDLIQSNQYVLAFNQRLGKNMNFQAEIYLQNLSNVPVSITENRIYWMLNDVQGFGTESLSSIGTGRNMGIDLYLEKFFDKGTFFILSTSVFNSTFSIPNNEKQYNTQYNGQFSATFTGGKVWELKKNTSLEFGLRVLSNAGNPISPIAKGFETIDGPDPVLDESEPFNQRVKAYIRPDLRIALRKNKSKVSYWLALDIQNFINRRNEDFIDYEFNSDQKKWVNRLQSGLTPLITFQLDF